MTKNRKRLYIVLTAILAIIIIGIAIAAVSCNKNKGQTPAAGNTGDNTRAYRERRQHG